MKEPFYVIVEERFGKTDRVVNGATDLETARGVMLIDMRENGYSAPAGFNEHMLQPLDGVDLTLDYRLYSDGVETPYVARRVEVFEFTDL